MRPRIHIFAAVLVLTTQATLNAEPDPNQFNPDWRVTFSGEQMREWFVAQRKPRSDGEPGEVWLEEKDMWTPSEEDVDRFESLVAPRLVAEIARHRYEEDKRPRLADYYRQYIGLTRDGTRVIVLNGLHRSFIELEIEGGKPNGFWKNELTGAFDGGCMFVHATFEPVEGSIEGVACNRDPLRDAVDGRHHPPQGN